MGIKNTASNMKGKPMSHSLTKIWLHTVFGTKEREPLIRTEFEESLHDHIKNHLEKDFGCCLQAMNGTADHLHILFLLDQNYAVKDILQNVKGESSHWVNQKDFMKTKFAWQTGYGAFSVSKSNLNDVEIYIKNQKEHHRKKSFAEEYQEFIDKY
jgi:REP element-mobilizing transposase RayT